MLVKYTVVDDIDFRKGLQRWLIRQGRNSSIRTRILDVDARIDEVLLRVGNELPVVREAIQLLNRKIDVALEGLPEIRESMASFADIPAQECELSADGLAFGSDEEIEVGAKLYLAFMLISDSRFFETFGSVIRVHDHDDTSAYPYRYKIVADFQGMQSAEREILIQHLFSAQSAELRLRRTQTIDLNE